MWTINRRASMERTWPRRWRVLNTPRRRERRGHRGRLCSDNPATYAAAALSSIGVTSSSETKQEVRQERLLRLRRNRHRRRPARLDHRICAARKIRGVLVGRVFRVEHGGICLVSPLRHRRRAGVRGNAIGDADDGCDLPGVDSGRAHAPATVSLRTRTSARGCRSVRRWLMLFIQIRDGLVANNVNSPCSPRDPPCSRRSSPD